MEVSAPTGNTQTDQYRSKFFPNSEKLAGKEEVVVKDGPQPARAVGEISQKSQDFDTAKQRRLANARLQEKMTGASLATQRHTQEYVSPFMLNMTNANEPKKINKDGTESSLRPWHSVCEREENLRMSILAMSLPIETMDIVRLTRICVLVLNAAAVNDPSRNGDIVGMWGRTMRIPSRLLTAHTNDDYSSDGFVLDIDRVRYFNLFTDFSNYLRGSFDRSQSQSTQTHQERLAGEFDFAHKILKSIAENNLRSDDSPVEIPYNILSLSIPSVGEAQLSAIQDVTKKQGETIYTDASIHGVALLDFIEVNTPSNKSRIIELSMPAQSVATENLGEGIFEKAKELIELHLKITTPLATVRWNSVDSFVSVREFLAAGIYVGMMHKNNIPMYDIESAHTYLLAQTITAAKNANLYEIPSFKRYVEFRTLSTLDAIEATQETIGNATRVIMDRKQSLISDGSGYQIDRKLFAALVQAVDVITSGMSLAEN